MVFSSQPSLFECGRLRYFWIVVALAFLVLTSNKPVYAQSFSDNFNRPDGAVGNGWVSWNGTALVSGQVENFGSGSGGGISRSFPVTLPVTFSFDFSSGSPHPSCDFGNNLPGGDWLIGFNAPGTIYSPETAQFEFFQYYGSQPIVRAYASSAGYVVNTVPSASPDFGLTPVHITGTVNMDLSATITIGGATYTFGPAPATNPLAAAAGSNLILSNSSCGGGPYFFDNFSVTSSGCQVSYRQPGFHQVDRGVPQPRYAALIDYPSVTDPTYGQYFGHLPAPNPPSGQAAKSVLCPTIQSGCALDALTTMLTSFTSLNLQNLTPTQLDAQLRATSDRYGFSIPSSDGTEDGIKLCPLDNPNCPANARVRQPDWCEFNPPGPELAFPFDVSLEDNWQVASNGELWDPDATSLVPLNKYLNDRVCTDQDTVLLQLDETDTDAGGIVTHPGKHYLFVTGQTTTSNGTPDWNVFDPGWTTANPQPNLSTLSGHLQPPGITTGGVQRIFSVAGVRTYSDISSTANIGSLSIIANSPVELWVTDPEGRQLGSLGGADIFGIPRAGYSREFPLADDTSTETSNGDPTGIKTIHISSPLNGSYKLILTGTGLGIYTLTFDALATDGTIQNASVVGVTNVGTGSQYTVSYSSTPGSPLTVAPVATFQSTLADIANSLALGLIDNAGIANALTSKIQAASAAASSGQTQAAGNILNAFLNQVNAQTGIHINGIAPQVLVADANSLLNQLQ